MVKEFARAYQEETNRLALEKTQRRAGGKDRLEAVRYKIASMLRAIEDGLYQPSMKARMAEREAEKAALEERLAVAPEPPKGRLHPNMAGLYRHKVAALEEALVDPAVSAKVMEFVRRQIERITLTPGADGGLEVLLHGDLPRILIRCS
jgi:site-specific DNA recombinase